MNVNLIKKLGLGELDQSVVVLESVTQLEKHEGCDFQHRVGERRSTEF